MKKLFFTFVSLSLVIMVLVGCNQGNDEAGSGDRPEESPPFYTGEIEEVAAGRVLVSGSSNSYDSEKFSFIIEEDSVIVSGDGDVLIINDLEVGKTVDIWLMKDRTEIMESYPPQAFAGRIVVH